MKEPTARDFLLDLPLFILIAVVMTWVWLWVLPALIRYI